jgi:hypothetical protein
MERSPSGPQGHYRQQSLNEYHRGEAFGGHGLPFLVRGATRLQVLVGPDVLLDLGHERLRVVGP